jgi:hypothetical protein
VTLLDVQPNAEFNLNTGYATINLLLATDTPASLYDAGVLVATRLNAAPELAGQFVASVVVSGPTVQVVVTYTLAGANARILGSEDCGSAFDDSTGQSCEWSSNGLLAFAAPYPTANSVAQSNSRFLCCPVPCAAPGMETYLEFRVWIECISENPYEFFIAQPGDCGVPIYPVLGCGDFVGLSGVAKSAAVDAIIADLQLASPTAVITRDGLDVIVITGPIGFVGNCALDFVACYSGEIVAHVIQQSVCCEPDEPCVPGIDYQPQASSSPVFTEGVGDIFDAVAVFYADCCSPVDGTVLLTNEADGVSLVGLPVVTPLGGNQYSVSQSVEYDGTPIVGTPGEQMDGGTLTFTVACGGADDTAIQIAAIIAEPEDPAPTCPITVVQATTATVSRTEFLAAVTHGIGTRITTPGCCALPNVSGVVTYEDIPGRLTINPIPVIQTLVANTSFYTVLNVQFDSSTVTGVAPPYPKLVGTVLVTITCGDSTITRTVNFYLLDPA